MKKYYTLAILLLITQFSFAQTRYLDSLFVPVKSQQDVTYGQAPALNFPYFFEPLTSTQDLKLDVYEPQGDNITNRPCIVYAHGGAFLLGSKTDAPVVKFCEQMAAKGYVVVSIDYRLGFNLTDSASAERAVYRGVQDMKAAIRYVKNQSTNWNLDTSRVFAAGNSAGSLMAIHAAYVDEAERSSIASTFNTPDLGCLSCSGNSLTHGDYPLAIANLWGAIIDTNLIGANNNVPMISFHGTADNIVFPGEARPFSSPSFPAIQGSDLLTPRLNNLNIDTEYWSFSGEGHEPWGGFGGTTYFDTIVTATANFFYSYLAPAVATHQIEKSVQLHLFPNPTTDILNITSNDWEGQKMELTIVNALGQIVLTQQISATNRITIPVQNLTNGWYAVVLRGEDFRIAEVFLKE